MNDVVGQRIGRYSVWARMYVTFAAAALLLAALGVYGVLSFDVTLRRPEIGVRRALGASSVSVQARILRDTGVRVAIGLALGLWLGALMADGIAYALYGVDTRDLGVFAAVGGLLAGIALLASWAPAPRAAAVDPVTAIRSE
jgi:ABC-type antimicrobial peptide transport system permease subunit